MSDVSQPRPINVMASIGRMLVGAALGGGALWLYVANAHNSIGRFYETFGGRGADTGMRNVGGESNRDWYRPNPPLAPLANCGAKLSGSNPCP